MANVEAKDRLSVGINTNGNGQTSTEGEGTQETSLTGKEQGIWRLNSGIQREVYLGPTAELFADTEKLVKLTNGTEPVGPGIDLRRASNGHKRSDH